MNILFNIAVSLIASAAIFVGGMNMPANVFSLSSLKTSLFGSFTEITTATNLADFPTTYNANLNKTIEVGTTSVASITTLAGLTSASSLATIGTIISGIWNGTAIGVGYGGTGTTSPTSNQVMLGNGASGFKVIGFGSSGQFLTSGGASVAPSWQTASIDQAGTYTWTGANMWTASTTHTATTSISASSVTNNALVLNTLPYKFQSTRAASSTVLAENGSGSLTWNSIDNLVTTFSYVGAPVATSTSYGQNQNNYTDTTFTTGFKPSVIKINYNLKSSDSGGTYYQSGTAEFNSTTLVSNLQLASNSCTANVKTIDASTINYSTGAIGCGVKNAYTTLVIQSITNTSFVVRMSSITTGFGVGNYAASMSYYPVAYK